MRKITEKAITALLNGHNFNEGNTIVASGLPGEKGVVNKMYLHGNLIASKCNGKITITNAGWFSNTTKERLNALPGVSIYQKKGVWYLNGKEWDGKETTI